jgi:predicted RND superfamily exporter protein
MKKHFTHKFIDSPFKTIMFSVILIALFAAGVSKLYSNFGYRVWFQETNPNLIEFDAFERKFGSDEVALIAVNSPDGVFDNQSLSLLKNLTEDLWQSKDAIRVDSITNYNWVHSEGDDILVEPLIPEEYEDINASLLLERKEIALNHNVIPDYLINRKGNTALIYVNLKPSINEIPDYKEIVGSLRRIVRKYQVLGGKKGAQTPVLDDPEYDNKISADKGEFDYGDNHTFYITGNPALTFAFQEELEKFTEIKTELGLKVKNCPLPSQKDQLVNNAVVWSRRIAKEKPVGDKLDDASKALFKSSLVHMS